jgi:hypothetical protein
VSAKNRAGTNAVAYLTPSGKQTRPNPPINSIIADVSSAAITIAWDPNSNPGTPIYGILRSQDNFLTSTTTIKGFDDRYTSVSFIDTNVLPNATYYYKVNAYNSSGLSTEYDIVVYALTQQAPVGKPTGLLGIAITTNSINWSWFDNSGSENGFKVYTSTNLLLANLAADTTYWKETLLPENMTCIRYVQIFNAVSSINSNLSVSSYTFLNPPADTELTVTVSSSTVLTILVTQPPNSNSGATGCEFDNITGFAYGGNDSGVMTGSYTYVDTGLRPNTQFGYKVR